jgi:ubiquinone/menaquinone biosynthesis C-methylase UbiE
MTTSHRIHDYDAQGAASYRQDFWENANRAYEDRVERIALQRLLRPASGQRLVELGAGFGRLSSFYAGYQQVILLDYAKSQLEDARSRLGDEKYLYVAANIYELPIATAACDAASMIRVLHHFEDVPAALAQIRRTLCDGGLFLLEFANKRNLKAMIRYALGRQDWTPYSLPPIEFVKLHFDFHPRYIDQELQKVGFDLGERLAVSYFRLGLVKKLLPTGALCALDSVLQGSGLLYSPSIFTRNTLSGVRPSSLPSQALCCPRCHGQLAPNDVTIQCEACQLEWSTANGIYDFRQPL